MKPLSVNINPPLSIVHPLSPTNTLYNIINTHYYQLYHNYPNLIFLDIIMIPLQTNTNPYYLS